MKKGYKKISVYAFNVFVWGGVLGNYLALTMWALGGKYAHVGKFISLLYVQYAYYLVHSKAVYVGLSSYVGYQLWKYIKVQYIFYRSVFKQRAREARYSKKVMLKNVYFSEASDIARIRATLEVTPFSIGYSLDKARSRE